MHNKRLRFPWTAGALVGAGTVTVVAIVGQVNLVQWPAALLARIDVTEVDDLLTAFAIVAIAFVIDQTMAARAANRTRTGEAERRRHLDARQHVLRAVVHHNFDALQRLRLDAESRAPAETLRWFDATIREATWRLTAFCSPAAGTEGHRDTGAIAATPSLSRESSRLVGGPMNGPMTIGPDDQELLEWPPPAGDTQQVGSVIMFARRSEPS